VTAQSGFLRESLETGLLTVPERNAAFRQVVRGQLQSDAIAGQDSNSVAAEPARQVRQDNAVLLELNTKKSAGEFL